MQVTIDATPIGPLEILRSLPSARLAILEGLNGIGKTLAVRLLQVCTGTLPYPTDSAEWASMCEGLGPFEVHISQLAGVGEIYWKADSRVWLRGRGLGAEAAVFDRIEVDGTPVTIDRLRDHLVVERIAGDEDLLEVLAKDADAEAERVRVWMSRYAGANGSPLAALEQAIAGVQSEIRVTSADEIRSAREALDKSAEQITVQRRQIASLDSRRVDLLTAVELSERIEQMRNRAPGIESRLRDIDQQIDAERERRRTLDRQISALAAKAAMAGPARHELRNARRTLERNRTKLEDAAKRAAAAASNLGLADYHARYVDDELAAARRLVERLANDQTAVDAAPALQNLIGSLGGELNRADASGLGGQILVDVARKGVQLTVDETREGIISRREQLEAQPKTDEARTIAAEIAAARTRLGALRSVKSNVGEIERFQRLVAENEDRVSAALAVANVKAAEEMQEIEARRRDSDEVLLRLAAERAGLQEQLGTDDASSTLVALEGQLDELLRASDLEEARLDDALATCTAEYSTERDRLLETQNEMELRRNALARLEGDVLGATEVLESPEYRWLADALGTPLPARGADVLTQVDAHRRIHRTLDAALESLGAYRTALGALRSAFSHIGAHLRGRDGEDVKYRPSLEAWLGERYSSWFNSGPVRSQLLPEATTAASVDVARRVLTWDEGGVTRERPLQAFSSGEQAFAYTRARVAALDEGLRLASNRLVVLDEFGAFIAHDRLGRLATFLRERLLQHPEDQILMILPLSRDYSELAATSIGEEAARYADLAQEVRDRKYAVQVLE